jgi:hypothetical protein
VQKDKKGFSLISEDEDGNKTYALGIAAGYKQKQSVIKVN